MRISVIGTGYVGLISGLCLSEKGHKVVCIDNNQKKIDKIKKGDCIIYEEGLEKLLRKNLGKNFSVSNDLTKSILETDISIIAVGTPYDGKSIDLKYIKKVSEEIGTAIKSKLNYHLIVVKSTVVPGTTDTLVLPTIEKKSGKKVGIHFGVGMNPEFLREGNAVDDFMNPDRIVIGSYDEKSASMMKEIYKPFKGIDIISTNNKTAEMIKYANNSFLATLISFSNEIGNLCLSQKDTDVIEVLKGVHLDNRVSPIIKKFGRVQTGITSYLESGCGFGGSCFPKDVKALISYGKKNNLKMELLNSVININKEQPLKLIKIIKKHYKNIRDMNISVLGLSFKPGTDDMRESPSIPIIKSLIKMNAKVTVYDPIAMNESRRILKNLKIKYGTSLKKTVIGSQIIILVTSWPEFKSLKLVVSKMEKQPLVIDGRRFLHKKDFQRYEGLGYSK